ncbi:hypothetical protein ACOSQ2_014008 [Xanthoceras sorbifolium]
MEIYNMNNLKTIWHNQLDGNSFRKLKSLQVEKCQKLLTLFPSNICERFLSLEFLTVRECGYLQEIFDLQGIISEELFFPNLQKTRSFRVSKSEKSVFCIYCCEGMAC